MQNGFGVMGFIATNKMEAMLINLTMENAKLKTELSELKKANQRVESSELVLENERLKDSLSTALREKQIIAEEVFNLVAYNSELEQFIDDLKKSIQDLNLVNNQVVKTEDLELDGIDVFEFEGKGFKDISEFLEAVNQKIKDSGEVGNGCFSLVIEEVPNEDKESITEDKESTEQDLVSLLQAIVSKSGVNLDEEGFRSYQQFFNELGKEEAKVDIPEKDDVRVNMVIPDEMVLAFAKAILQNK